MPTIRLRFPGAHGDSFTARLDQPEGEPLVCALFAHCFTCSKDLKAVRRISGALAARGIAVLRFDFTGLRESEGEFADTNFSSNLDDLIAAGDFLRREYRAPSLLIGHSLGGTAMLAVAARIPESVAIATIGAPATPAYLRDTLLSAAPDLHREEEAMAVIAGRPFRVRRQLLDDLDQQTMQSAIAGSGRQLLVFHSVVDEVVDFEEATLIFEAAHQPKSLVSLASADHLLVADARDAAYIGGVLASWAERYLD